MTTISPKDFLDDHQGRKYRDVTGDSTIGWDTWINWLNDNVRQERMEIAEIHFGMPALAGVLKELEKQQFAEKYLGTRTPQETKRLKQALGVLVRMHMEARGWSKTGVKGPLGRRDSGYGGSGPHNTPRSFSKYILSSEHYENRKDSDDNQS